jgi:hypothetical protein
MKAGSTNASCNNNRKNSMMKVYDTSSIAITVMDCDYYELSVPHLIVILLSLWLLYLQHYNITAGVKS